MSSARATAERITCQKINRSHTDRSTENNTPDTDTHAHDKNNTPNPQTKHLPQTLNNARRWRDDGELPVCVGGNVSGIGKFVDYYYYYVYY